MCIRDSVQSAQTNHFVTVDRNIRADIPLYLAGQQSGVDLQVDARLLTGKVKWNVSTNISINRNKVVSLGGLDAVSYTHLSESPFL